MNPETAKTVLEAAVNGPRGNLVDVQKINLAELACELGWAETWYSTAHKHKSGARARVLTRKLSDIGKTARRLKTLLSKDNWAEIARLYPHDLKHPRVFLCHLIKAVDSRCAPKLVPESEAQLRAGLPKDLGIGRMSAFEWLVGKYLPTVFEEHLRVPPVRRYGDSSECSCGQVGTAAYVPRALGGGARREHGPSRDCGKCLDQLDHGHSLLQI